MIKIEGDYSNIQVTTMSEYYNGNPGVKVSLSIGSDLLRKIEKFERMERQWQDQLQQLSEQQELINNNPAVKEAFNNFQTLLLLAKDYNAKKL